MDTHNLKIMLQNHFSDGLVTIVGSGLSCAEGLPGMQALAAHLETNLGESLSHDDAEAWQQLIPAIKANGLEAALLARAPSPSLEAAIAECSAELMLSHERRVIAEVFGGQRVLRFTRLLRHLLKPSSGIPIVTTNYDRLIEIAAEEAGLGVDTMFVGQFAGELNERESRLSFCREVTVRGKQVRKHYRERVNVCKPHGSLDWYYRDGRPVRYSGDLKAPRLLITPGLNKFRNGYASPFDRHRERGNAAVDIASRFLVIGYGFNDDHLETHLTPMIRSGKPTLMLTHQLTPNAASLAEKCMNVIALESGIVSGESGTMMRVGAERTWLPNLQLWELGHFISEVLEP